MKDRITILFMMIFIFSSLEYSQNIEWFTFGNGLSSNASAVAVKDSEIYVGGSFALAGGIQVNGIAKWDGSSWSALGSGVDLYVNAIAVIGNDIYAAGFFNLAGGVPVNNIAKWDGNSWSPLGQGVNSDVQCLAVNGTDLYAGGFFTMAGNNSAYRIAKWDGNSWSPLGGGINNEVDAIAVLGNDVYAGGIFSSAGGVPVNSIAKWDGSSWSALGNGVSGIVRGIAIDGDVVYAGGVIDGEVLKWDGSVWSSLGSGVNGSVFSLQLSENDLYVGGLFTVAGGLLANKIAKFNIVNETWSPIDGGVTAEVDAMAIQGATNSLVITGAFSHVGNNIEANYIARFTDSENPLPIELSSFTALPEGNKVNLNWSTSTEINNKGFEVQRSVSGDQNSHWNDIGFVEGNGTTSEAGHYSFADEDLVSGVYLYRLKQIDFDGTFSYSKIIEVNFTIPAEFTLEQNYPNPFNPSTTIRYSVPSESKIKLSVFDVSGSEIETLVNQQQPAGNYSVEFNASHLSSGIYYYRMSAGSFSQTRKLILLK
jgi:hypothetical protein